MSQSKGRSPSIRHYFVDEAGDGTLFSRRGRIYGVYYSQKKPLELAALGDLPGI